MQELLIQGGVPLRGTIRTSGAKNAALPILMATLLAPGVHRISNLPALRDVGTAFALLRHLGARSDFAGCEAHIDTRLALGASPPAEIVRRMRASVLAMGPLLARHGRCQIALPGGCAIGLRPIEQHLLGLERMGARFHLDDGQISGHATELHGANIRLSVPTVTGTENLMMAATLARGTTEIHNAACEPEIEDLALFLRAMGARVHGAGTPTITIEGVRALHPSSRSHRVIPDRIEAGTYLCAAAAVPGSDITVTHLRPRQMTSTLAALAEAGCVISDHGSRVRCAHPGGRLGPIEVTTAPYPGIPTDMQAQLCALAALGSGVSHVEETVFENRFGHLTELGRMGAVASIDGRRATIHGGDLAGRIVHGPDLRGTAALVIAGLAARGCTRVRNLHHLDRGYERLEAKLVGVGAHLQRRRIPQPAHPTLPASTP